MSHRVINAYESEYKRWKVVRYNGLTNESRPSLYYVVRDGWAKSGLLSSGIAYSTCHLLAQRAAEAVAARAEEEMLVYAEVG